MMPISFPHLLLFSLVAFLAGGALRAVVNGSPPLRARLRPSVSKRHDEPARRHASSDNISTMSQRLHEVDRTLARLANLAAAAEHARSADQAVLASALSLLLKTTSASADDDHARQQQEALLSGLRRDERQATAGVRGRVSPDPAAPITMNNLTNATHTAPSAGRPLLGSNVGGG